MRGERQIAERARCRPSARSRARRAAAAAPRPAGGRRRVSSQSIRVSPWPCFAAPRRRGSARRVSCTCPAAEKPSASIRSSGRTTSCDQTARTAPEERNTEQRGAEGARRCNAGSGTRARASALPATRRRRGRDSRRRGCHRLEQGQVGNAVGVGGRGVAGRILGELAIASAFALPWAARMTRPV